MVCQYSSEAVVGVFNDEDPNGTGRSFVAAGLAYVLSRMGGWWTREAKLAADDGDNNALFTIQCRCQGR